MKKLFVLAGLFAVAAVAGYFIYMQPTKPTVDEVQTAPQSYTLAQVAEHAGRESCWIAIDGKVYDVTSYVQSGFHPGKEAILMGCGKDATELFRNRPNGSGSHSDKAQAMLAKFYIGELKS